jgi:ArsR family transcriptional regulator
VDVTEASDLLRLLGDPVRLRLLRALSQEALNVSELTAVVGLAQSGVSRHLGLLRRAGVVVEERRGAFTLQRLSPDAEIPSGSRAPLWAWLRSEFGRTSGATRADDARLAEVRRLRKESFLEHGAAAERRQLVPGRSWAAWSRALGLLLPRVDVADLGCGEGYLTIEAARWARTVVAVDRSPAVIARARAMARRRKVRNIVWKRGELDRLPLKDRSVDIVLLSQALHHADSPEGAVAEARRILRPGGRIVVLDLRQHDEGWVRATLGDRWLGFTEERLRDLLAGAGFEQVVVRVAARRAGDPFTVLVGGGRVSFPRNRAQRGQVSRTPAGPVSSLALG